MNDKLVGKFKYIKENHHDNIRRRISKTAWGYIATKFTKGTKKELSEFLYKKIDVKKLGEFKSQEEYKDWFEKNLTKLANVLKKRKRQNVKPSLCLGYTWGYAAKILNLYIRDIVEYSRYFDKKNS